MTDIKIIECPRDAMQGWEHLIPTEDKIRYNNQLLKVGFDTIDFTSFVSHRLIPQMADSEHVAEGVERNSTNTKLLSVVLNRRGAEDALKHKKVDILGFPLSVSPTFQQRNANSTIPRSLDDIKYIKALCEENGKELLVYLSMSFGNPYGDEYSKKIVALNAEKVAQLGIHTISLADTVGLASPAQIEDIVKEIIRLFPENEIGIHLHSTLENWKDKLNAAHSNGCNRFDGAIHGYGGCPMAEDELVGNMNTGLMVRYFKDKGYLKNINDEELIKAEQLASAIFLKP